MAHWRQQARRLAWGTGDEHTRPVVRRLSRESPFSLIVETLEEDGCVIIRDFVSPTTLGNIAHEIFPLLAKAGLDGFHSKTVATTLQHSAGLRDIYAGTLNQALAAHFLSLEVTHYENRTQVTTSTAPRVSSARATLLSAGSLPRPLVRPDAVHRARHLHAETYEPNRDTSLGLFFPGADVSGGKGTLRIVPGSHLWGDGAPVFDGRVLDIEMAAGEALFVLGSVYLGFGAYEQRESSLGRHSHVAGVLSEKTHEVLWHALFSCNGATRQEEAGVMAYPHDRVAGWPHILKEQVGWPTEPWHAGPGRQCQNASPPSPHIAEL